MANTLGPPIRPGLGYNAVVRLGYDGDLRISRIVRYSKDKEGDDAEKDCRKLLRFDDGRKKNHRGTHSGNRTRRRNGTTT